MNELFAHKADVFVPVHGTVANADVYFKDKVDPVISELKAENAELKQKLESVQATAYAESVDAGMRERRLKRALYKACANWALSTLAWLDCIDQGEPRKWSEMVQKCRAKAEEYK